ncbi:pentatricopeptide repeat-containing protein [Corchorus capsularis]|uniref:Pentatricopeptide repeat-containing protein n=1 Tax=Corchorus capsularis TaxID=210143 RepID=A0A1R3GKW8_COCAP|nr:pentatricopeptide repeat-containing protein [Corchorus capsularis]
MFKNRIAIDEKLDYMKPDLAACNAALECCCYELRSVSDAEKVDKSIGYGIISTCINLGLSDKAHSILDEMNAQGGSVGHRTAEATQLVMDISNAGLQLDSGMYDAPIEASMTSQDFQSAFTLFRDTRDARIPNLKGSYLTIMTCLMENQRPELMAAFFDEVVEDPCIEVKTHDWNSIIHAFCDGQEGIKFDRTLVDAFLYALVKGGFFDAVMQVVEKSQEMRIFVDKWRYKQAFMEKHKKLKVSKLRKRSFRKMEALIAFKNWAVWNPVESREVLTPKANVVTSPSYVSLCTGFGCGHPYFARYIKCNAGVLQFSTGTGIDTVSSIDYPTSTIVAVDPFMSTCSSMQNSGSFSLDRASPFTLTGSRVCSGLYSCKGVTGIGLAEDAPTATCCVYDSLMGVGSACKNCETSGGLCGFSVLDQSFTHFLVFAEIV